MKLRVLFPLAIALLIVAGIYGQAPVEKQPDNVKRIPPPGAAIPAGDRAALEKGRDELGQEIAGLGKLANKQTHDLLPDVEIFYNAVHYALKYDEFFNAKEAVTARKLLELGYARAKELREGKPSWTTATGLVVRGYRSKIDGSAQPYGLVVPNTLDPKQQSRLDFWCHGRGETLSELSFINGRLQSKGEFTPKDAIVLHLYGRYCNANRFAGEVDLFEAMDHVKKYYAIDENRLVIRGFSMGGAACWQFATHYPGLWVAAAPGAGFSETVDFLKLQKQLSQIPDYQKKLWHWYDAIDYAGNLRHVPTVAYSGEIDGQKQAADMMDRAMAAEGLKMTHVIGPKTGHKYETGARNEINKQIDAIVAKGLDKAPHSIRFTTWTLHYPQAFWARLEGLDKHWERARVEADFAPATGITMKTTNVSAFTLDLPGAIRKQGEAKALAVQVDGQALQITSPKEHFRKTAGKWQLVQTHDAASLRKQPGLQGPIDDAFLNSFVMVRPTGQAANAKVGAWVEKEMKHATEHWRRQFRGEAIVKDDTAITDADIANSNLVLWGDPSSNHVLAKLADKLPIGWNKDKVTVGPKSYGADDHAAVLVYPNPLNPKKYVVLNSGFTFREFDYLNNARQSPKLPDFAVIDVTAPVTSRTPGRVVTADFFTESWELPGK